VNSTGKPLALVYTPLTQESESDHPSVGVQDVLRFKSSAMLTLPILWTCYCIQWNAEVRRRGISVLGGDELSLADAAGAVRSAQFPVAGCNETADRQSHCVDFPVVLGEGSSHAWRFLTYFGRHSMIAALLLDPVLSYGPGRAMEAVIGAVWRGLMVMTGRLLVKVVDDVVDRVDNVTLRLRVRLLFSPSTSFFTPF
jgi:hypothetical protein